MGKTAPLPTTVRPLRVIAAEMLPLLRALPETNMARWAGVPYSEPLLHLDTVDDTYGCDSGSSVVLYALGNLSTWRGADATRIRAELRAHTKGVKPA